MFKHFKYATNLTYVNGYYRIIIVDSLFEEELPLEEEPFNDWDYNFVYAASAFDFYKKKKMNAVKNYCGFLRQIYGGEIGARAVETHVSAIHSLFPEYPRNIYPCVHREIFGV